jgi:hypothetical protein
MYFSRRQEAQIARDFWPSASTMQTAFRASTRGGLSIFIIFFNFTSYVLGRSISGNHGSPRCAARSIERVPL